MSRKQAFPVTDASSFRRGQLIATGGLPDYEYLRVVRVGDRELMVVPWRWWHTAMSRPGVHQRRFRWWLDERIVAWEDRREAKARRS